MSGAPGGAGSLEILAWDSSHYGVTVARLGERSLDADALGALLDRARRDGVRLLYWLAEHGRAVDRRLLAEYGGRRVMGHVRYARALPAAAASGPPARGEFALEVDAGRAEDEPALVRLGVAAGVLSRFRMDERLPAAKCDELYELWIRKSRTKELADEVLLARRAGAPVGLTTFRVRGGVAEIGLVSTDAAERGLGVGTALLELAHARIALRGVARVEVVTQAENAAACRLYERQGYAPSERGDYYHFMPNS